MIVISPFKKEIRSILTVLCVLFNTINIQSIHSQVFPLIEVTSFARCPPGTDALRLGPLPLKLAPVFENAVFNPMVIANQNNSNNLFIVCSQGLNLHYLADLTIFSTDGGITWNQSDLITGRAQGPTLSGAPNDFVSPTDPYAASDTNGNLYFGYSALQLINPDGSPNFANALNFTKSNNLGIGWNATASIENNLNPPQQAFVNRPTITVNPFNPNILYAVWGNLAFVLNPALPQTFELQISRDGGNTWSAPRTIATLDGGVFGFNAILHILPDHSPIVIYQSNNPDGTFNIIALKSKDFVNWTPHLAYKNGVIAHVSDPNNSSLSFATYTFGTDSKINQRTGELYITWADAKANPHSTPWLPAAGVFISRSKDGGKTWSSPIVANPKTVGVQTFSPAIAIAANGTIGVSFYDFRGYKNTGDINADLKTNLWLALFDHKLECRLEELRLTPESFDARKFTFVPGEGFIISRFGTIGSVANDFLIAYPTTNPPYGGGPIVVQPGQIYDGLPVSLKFVRASTSSCYKDKIPVQPFLEEFKRMPSETGAQMLKKHVSKLVNRY